VSACSASKHGANKHADVVLHWSIILSRT